MERNRAPGPPWFLLDLGLCDNPARFSSFPHPHGGLESRQSSRRKVPPRKHIRRGRGVRAPLAGPVTAATRRSRPAPAWQPCHPVPRPRGRVRVTNHPLLPPGLPPEGVRAPRHLAQTPGSRPLNPRTTRDVCLPLPASRPPRPGHDSSKPRQSFPCPWLWGDYLVCVWVVVGAADKGRGVI